MKHLLLILLIAALAALAYVTLKPSLVPQEARLHHALHQRINIAVSSLKPTPEDQGSLTQLSMREFIVLSAVQQFSGNNALDMTHLLDQDADTLAQAFDTGKAELARHLGQKLNDQTALTLMELLLLLSLTETAFDANELRTLLGKKSGEYLVGFEAGSILSAFNRLLGSNSPIPCEDGVCYVTEANLSLMQNMLEPLIDLAEQELAPLLESLSAFSPAALREKLTLLEEKLTLLHQKALPLMEELEAGMDEIIEMLPDSP